MIRSYILDIDQFEDAIKDQQQAKLLGKEDEQNMTIQSTELTGNSATLQISKENEAQELTESQIEDLVEEQSDYFLWQIDIHGPRNFLKLDQIT